MQIHQDYQQPQAQRNNRWLNTMFGEKRIKELENEIKTLREEKTARDSVVFFLDEKIPKEEKARKKYMADISFFHNTIFKDKITQFISLQQEQLSQIGHPEKQYDIWRSNINCFRLIDEWMERCSSEYYGDLQEIRSRLDNDDDFINKIKETYEVQG